MIIKKIVNQNLSFLLPGLDIPKEDFESSGDFAIKSFQFLEESE